MLLLAVIAASAATATSTCPEHAPLVDRFFHVIAAVGPIVSFGLLACVVGLTWVIRGWLSNRGINAVIVCVTGAVAGGVLLVWFWSALLAGYVPQYVRGHYEPANATILELTNRTYACTRVINCVCERSADPPCAAVEASLLRDSTAASARCAGQTCCARSVFRCIRTETVCESRYFCTTTCVYGVNECIVDRFPETCTAVRGICVDLSATYGVVNRCNQSAVRMYKKTCVHDPQCVSDFTRSIAPTRTIYVAPWNANRQSETAGDKSPAGQLANVAVPGVLLLVGVCVYITMMVSAAVTVDPNKAMVDLQVKAMWDSAEQRWVANQHEQWMASLKTASSL